MLIEFSLENFKVFKDKATLSMVAHKPYKEKADSTFVPENFPDLVLSNTSVIYGANGAGKSSLIEGLYFIQQYIFTGFIEPESEDLLKPFSFKQATIENPNPPSSFELTFIAADGYKYHYGVALNNERIFSEFLLCFSKKGARAKTLFSRIYDEQAKQYEYYLPSLSETKRTIEVIVEKLQDNPKSTFLGALKQYQTKQIKPVVDWLVLSLMVIPYNVSRNYLDLAKSELVSSLKNPNKAEVKAGLISLLNKFDLSIADIRVVSNGPYDEIFFDHQVASGESYAIHFDELSSGSKRIFELALLLQAVLQPTHSRARILVFDEFEASFHPHIIETIFALFENAKNKSQLLVTTHSPTLLNPKLVRRDQVWFVEKNRDLASELYSLVDFAPSVKDNIADKWLQGRYGAVPYIDLESAV